MKWLPIALSLGFLLLAGPALAQKPRAGNARLGNPISVGEVTPTPEMWFYQQYVQQYEDPKTAVREKAKQRAAQRGARIAARRWFGFSASRPQAGSDVVHGDYSPRWVSGNVNFPFRWSGYGAAAVVVRPVRSNSVF